MRLKQPIALLGVCLIRILDPRRDCGGLGYLAPFDIVSTIISLNFMIIDLNQVTSMSK
jgi:hypothetical protein